MQVRGGEAQHNLASCKAGSISIRGACGRWKVLLPHVGWPTAANAGGDAHACVQVDEDQLPLGAALHASVALRYLRQGGARGAAAGEAAAATVGQRDEL